MATSPYHAGERSVQAAAGVREQAERVGKSIRPTIPPPAQAFLAAQPMVVLAGFAAGRTWAAALVGPPGFVRAVDDRRVGIDALPVPEDPVAEGLRPGAPIGLLAIDFATRRRMRLNGTVRSRGDGGFEVDAAQVYSNCPKYIQARQLDPPGGPVGPSAAARSPTLTPDQGRWLAAADTFFVSTGHPDAGADASHRGGQPGFVRVLGPDRLVFPDYAGNTMFQTLGNVAVDPRAGLLFVDFAGGRTLQLSGRAEIDWSPEAAAEFSGAERVVAYRIEEVVEIAGALPLRWRFGGYSPFNPR